MERYLEGGDDGARKCFLKQEKESSTMYVILLKKEKCDSDIGLRGKVKK